MKCCKIVSRSFPAACAVGLAVTVVLGVPARAALVTWTGNAADNEWLNAANWSSDPNLPVEGTGTTGDELEVNTTTNHPIFDVPDGARTYESIRVGYNGNGQLDVTGGTLIHDRNVQHRIGRGGNTGTVNISGNGTLQAGHIAELGIDANSVGIVNISGNGVWQLFRGATKDGQADVSVSLGAGNTGSGSVTIGDDGRVYTRFGVLNAQQDGLGTGLYHVDGGASLSLIGGNNGANPSNSGFWRQNATGTLQATVDALGNLGSIQIYDNGNLTSFVRFENGSKLELGFSGPPIVGSWDLMTFADGVLTDNGLTLDPAVAAAGWRFAFVDTGGTHDADTLRITYVPEPESIVLLLILGGTVVAGSTRRAQSN